MKANVSAKKDSIRVNTGAKKIEVNDDGEYIVLNFSDQSFVPRFFELIDYFENQFPSYEKRGNEIAALDIPELEKTKRISALNLELHMELKERVDHLFGPETCRKVFGDIVPAIDLYSQFFDLLYPYFSQYGKEREQAINSKYSPEKHGNAHV